MLFIIAACYATLDGSIFLYFFVIFTNLLRFFLEISRISRSFFSRSAQNLLRGMCELRDYRVSLIFVEFFEFSRISRFFCPCQNFLRFSERFAGFFFIPIEFFDVIFESEGSTFFCFFQFEEILPATGQAP